MKRLVSGSILVDSMSAFSAPFFFVSSRCPCALVCLCGVGVVLAWECARRRGVPLSSHTSSRLCLAPAGAADNVRFQSLTKFTRNAAIAATTNSMIRTAAACACLLFAVGPLIVLVT